MSYRDVLIADRRLCVLRTLASAPERRANHATLCDLLAVLGHSVSNEAMLAELAGWYASGKIKPVIDRQLPMQELPAAYAQMAARNVKGKLVLVNAP